jgi:F-type H+-transporting ATPase subunit gamma
MATLRDIKLRIVGVKSTQKITKAMKMVATAKLRRAQTRIINARPYAIKISQLLSNLVTESDINNNPLLKKREVKKVLLVVVTADRGLCGAFNANILREAVRYIEEELKPENISVSIYAVGKKSLDYFTSRNYNVVGSVKGLFSTLEYVSALQIYNGILAKFIDEETDKVVLIYNEFVSMIQQKIVNKQFLPIPLETKTDDASSDQSNFIYEPDQKEVFENLIPKHLKAQIWRSLLESNAAELGARMTAMDNATTNARDLIRSLNITYNKERQAAITKEILEIVSGANALKAGS